MSPKRQTGPSLQVIVTVSGGVADVLLKPKGVAVSIYDYDVQGSDEDGPGVSRDPDGHLCSISQWESSEEVITNRHWPVIKKALSGGYSRPWKCPDCGRVMHLTYEELAEAGSPICTNCDTEMAMQ